jgi:hypothetical protein
MKHQGVVRSLMVLIAAAGALCSTADAQPAVDPPLEIYLYVGPPVTGDPMPIPPGGSPTAFFVADLRLQSPAGGGGLPAPVKVYLFAGETKDETAVNGDYRTNLEVTIDDNGNSAKVSIEVWRGDRLVLRQYQALWLTTDPEKRKPGSIPER